MSNFGTQFFWTKRRLQGIIRMLNKIISFNYCTKGIAKNKKIAYNKVRKVRKKKGRDFMELAKVTTKGQITIPKAIRELLDLKEGSKIIFIQKGKDVIIKNSSMLALEKIQDAFEGEAERLGLKTEEDVVKMIKKSRKERKKD